MEIKKVTDAAFRKYGKVVENVDFTACGGTGKDPMYR